ncbi:MAG: hypothetical protein QM766_23820 [Burkholderiaceae bacterium]
MRAFRLPSSLTALALALPLSSTTIASAQTAPARCPVPRLHALQCDNGVRISAYEPAPDLAQWCDALADPDGRLQRLRPGSPVYRLGADDRALLTGLSGWLVLPREKTLLDTPEGISRFFTEYGCAPPG